MGNSLSVMADLLSARLVISRLRSAGKPETLRALAAQLAPQVGLAEAVVFDAIMRREALGPTGIGAGIAIPHCSIPGLVKPVGCFARLDKPIEFDAVDGRPVDLVFMLLSPEGEAAFHLKALATVCRLLRDETTARALRAAADESALYVVLAHHGAGR
jgi:PTS system nitrogen regulatory IIA component